MEIESHDVIRIVLQFLKESNLMDSMTALQRESGVTLNTVDSVDSFGSDIRHGRWDSVLTQTSALKLPADKLTSLYEQVLLELLEAGERELASGILQTAEPLISLKVDHPERYMKLENFCKRPYFNASDAYEMGSSKEQRRNEIAESLICEVSVVQPSRLLALLGQAMKYQQSQGLLPTGVPFDLFRNSRKAARRDAEEKIPKRIAGEIAASENSQAADGTSTAQQSKLDALLFAPDGQSFLTGSSSGVLESWDTDLMRVRQDLEYQSRGEFMKQDGAVLCCTFSRDGDHFATGNEAGQIKVWKISTGECLRTFAQAHPQGITSLTFYRDGTQLLSTSFDQTARIHGLKSGKALKEFRGHTSYVNCAVYTKDSSNSILTGSSDGTVKMWDVRSTECLLTYRPGLVPGVPVTRETAVHTLQLVPNSSDLVFVCTGSAQAFIVTTQGQVVKRFASGKQTGGDFTCATISPQGMWAYCVGEDGVMYVFDAKSSQLEHVLEVTSKKHAGAAGAAGADTRNGGQVLSVQHHPLRNLIATVSDTEGVKFWKP